MQKIFFSFIVVLITVIRVSAQNVSIHQEQSEYYKQFNYKSEYEFDTAPTLSPSFPKGREGRNSTIQFAKKMQVCSLDYAVYGWHPYWVGTAYNNYDFSLLSTFSYFSYELVPGTGSYSSIHSWKTTPSIDMAIATGCRVELCVTNFGSTNNTTFLTSPTAQQTLIDSLISLINYRSAQGVNIDFEGIPGSQRNNLTSFISNLSGQLKAAIPGASVSMAIFSVDWNNVYDIPALDPAVDQFIIMGYGYYYSGSSQAGPTATLYSDGSPWSSYNVVRSVNYYLGEGVTPSKLLLGLPYYGYEWQTVDNSVPSNTIAVVSSRTYKYERDNYRGVYTKSFDTQSFNPYYVFNTGNWYQCWVDDEYSLGKKYDMVKQKGIGGIGIWALGYDDGYSELWDLLRDKFTNCETVACSDTIYDTGGPFCNHYNNEDYTFTIAPTGAASVSLTFNSFQLEAGYDSLWIYDGPDISSPLIGGYSGITSPGTVNSNGNALTLRFFSDVGVTELGWEAVWNCTFDTVPPTTSINNPNTWETTDFTVTFADSDNTGGSGVDISFYQALEFRGTEWRANEGNGFFNDNFDSIIHPDWIDSGGTWNINTGTINQTDESQGNTNIYIQLAQDSSEIYLYHWQANMSGSGANRRSGIHFFSDDASLPNRGNSYFVYFRVDQDKCQIYKVVNDTWTLQTDDATTINPGMWYDFKVIFNPSTGEINVFQDEMPVSSWIDPSPHASGSYISLRTGNANVMYNDLKVYKARTGTETVTVGPDSTKDVRYQNPDPATNSCRIKSIVIDSAGNWSTPEALNVNIDWTPPTDVTVNDGISADIDTICSTTELSANWSSSSDPHSGIAFYAYAIGTSPGGNDVVVLVNNGLNTSVTYTGLSLTEGQPYYFTVAAANGAGLASNAISSDGQTVVLPPVADFISNDTLFFLPDDTVIFTNNSANASSYSWNFGDGNTSVDENPLHQYGDTGTYNVTLIAISSYCPDDTLTATNLIYIMLGTGISKGDHPLGWKVYPNPTKDVLFIKFYTNEIAGIDVYNLLGKLIYSERNITDKSNIVDLSQQTGGVYFIKLEIGGQSYHQKIILLK